MTNKPGTANVVGPLTDLFLDPQVMEIMVDGFDKVYVERQGEGGRRLEDVPSPFKSDSELLDLMFKLAEDGGRPLSEHQPMIDIRLEAGEMTARCNLVIPPIALHGPKLTLRKSPARTLTVDDLIGFGSLDQTLVDFLQACVDARLNICMSGGTGSGKTTMLNILANMIPDDERIIIVENATELRLHQPRVVRLESRPPDHDGRGEVTIQDLVINALRMRPDRLILGEARSGEMLELLQAMNTGHDGTLFSLHSNGPRDALSRMETMCLMAGMDLPLMSIRQHTASAIDIIVHQERLPDGKRKIVKITEMLGMEGQVTSMQDIFEFRRTGREEGRIQGHFTATGIIPRLLTRLRDADIELPVSMFTPV